jgi:hypothetical protein
MWNSLKDKLILIAIASLIVLGLSTLYISQVNKPEYVYVARGIQCKEYDKDSNVLKKCDDSQFGEVEIINPIAVLKIRIK